MFGEQREAFLRPLGGIAIGLLPIGRAHASSESVTRYLLLRGPSLLLEPSGRPSETRGRASACARCITADAGMFEHCKASLAPLGGIAICLSPIGRAHPTPLHDIRATDILEPSLDVQVRYTPELLHGFITANVWMFQVNQQV